MEASPFKSLLLQQLEKPLASINLPAAQIGSGLVQSTLPYSSNIMQAPATALQPAPIVPVYMQQPYNTNIIQAQAPVPLYNTNIMQTQAPVPPPQETQIVPAFMQTTLPYIPNQFQAATPPPPPLPPATVTKYLCFKCKTGSFDSFSALTEHQAICLASHNLFPFLTSTIISQPPPPPPPPLPTPPPLSPLIENKVLETPPPTKAAPLLDTKDITTTPSNLSTVATTTTSPSAAKKRFYKCSTCNTFHENWNLFLHLREHHNRHLCLYCVRFFPSAEKLALHLEIKHDLEQNHFNSEEALRKSIPQMEGYALEARFLLCCTCQHVFMETEQFSQHDCAEYIKPCALCGQKGRHTNQCKAHPDSKRFSKLKKKKEKNTQAPLLLGTNERYLLLYF